MRRVSAASAALLVPFGLAVACDQPGAELEMEAEAEAAAEQGELDGPRVVDEMVTEASGEYQGVEVRRVVEGLEEPWGVAFLEDGRKVITEQPGRVQLVDGETVTELDGVPEALYMNQGGMLDVVPHPDFEDNGWIYLTYSKQVDDDTSVPAVARARIDGDAFTDLEDVFESNEPTDPGRHYGSRIVFLDDGTMLVSIGDRGGIPESAQDPETHTGSVIRINDDGSVPDDNPFVGEAGYADEIYSYGHRNIQGMALHPETGEVWATEHGPRGGDQLNRIEAGNNYGWPDVTPGRDYGTQEQWGERHRDQEGITPPTWEFLPTLAPSGLAVIDGGGFADEWQGNLMAGGLRSQWLLRIVTEDHEVVHIDEILKEDIGRIRDVRWSPDEALYVTTDETDGGLYRIDPT